MAEVGVFSLKKRRTFFCASCNKASRKHQVHAQLVMDAHRMPLLMNCRSLRAPGARAGSSSRTLS